MIDKITRALANVNDEDAQVLCDEIVRLENAITAMIQMNNERLDQETCNHDLNAAKWKYKDV